MERAKILIIDDDPVCSGVLLAMLGDDYQVTTANSGSGGIDILNSMLPDLILLDITMPEVNGYQVLRFLKADSSRANIPVVVISTLVDSSDRDFALKLGANDYVNKPIMPDVIQKMVDQYLPY
ncbi:Response regulator CheB (Receptor modification enzyme, protein-glutamate methylesterase) [Shewanella benthica]|uniref:Response regulator CheB (Receptor modification enzyme, protein-glutamate methylesterase) n=1 Tax=Shewanella benthica TaxID=43661 RepID=A0A330M7S3_9GAMM|nr:response regulator [Shewanella benthica]SQH78218.1 Response regulator CheB (Receptor modification enzyme, protein-glutamate methylesterase) [Shewanella benthica]